jgi:hypothetical protein
MQLEKALTPVRYNSQTNLKKETPLCFEINFLSNPQNTPIALTRCIPSTKYNPA